MRFTNLNIGYVIRKQTINPAVDWLYWNADREMWVGLYDATIYENRNAAEAATLTHGEVWVTTVHYNK